MNSKLIIILLFVLVAIIGLVSFYLYNKNIKKYKKKKIDLRTLNLGTTLIIDNDANMHLLGHINKQFLSDALKYNTTNLYISPREMFLSNDAWLENPLKDDMLHQKMDTLCIGNINAVQEPKEINDHTFKHIIFYGNTDDAKHVMEVIKPENIQDKLVKLYGNSRESELLFKSNGYETMLI
jgi:hypothetical protein